MDSPDPADAAVPRAVVLAVDDNPDALAVLRHELEKRYGEDYDVRCEHSASAALRLLGDLKAVGRPVALVLAEHWMAEILGAEMLGQVHALHPTALRGLLIAWGDRATAEPILQAMAVGKFDQYLPKPDAAPDEGFHNIVEGLLADWAKGQGHGFTPIVVVGDPQSRRAHELRDLLTRNGLLHRIHPPDSPAGARLLGEAGLSPEVGPVLFVLNSAPLVNPSNLQIVDALKVNADPLRPVYDVVIVGAGPAGLGAAVYGASEGLSTLVIEREALGGQAGTSARIRNVLGFPRGISGGDLAIRAYEQAWLFGAHFHLMREVAGLRSDDGRHTVILADGSAISARAVVLATGVAYRRLGLPRLEALSGAGVFYGAAVAEAPAVRGQHVFIAGGANSAGQAALYLSQYAASVTLLVRGPGLAKSMSRYLITEIEATPKIHTRAFVELIDGGGSERLEQLTLRDTQTGAVETISADALFVMIGAAPHTAWLPPAILRDPWGFVVTGLDLLQAGQPPAAWPLQRPPMLLETSVPGIFAVGDVRHRSIKRVASAIGEGSICIALIHEYLASVEDRESRD